MKCFASSCRLWERAAGARWTETGAKGWDAKTILCCGLPLIDAHYIPYPFVPSHPTSELLKSGGE